MIHTQSVRAMYHIALTISLTLIFSFIGIIAMKYDFSIHNFHYYDIIQSSPYSILIALVWGVFVSFHLFYMRNNARCSDIFCMVFLSILAPLPFLIEVVANYPSIWARDVYLHGQIRFLDNVGRLDELKYDYPKQYPGFFLLWYIAYKATGITDIREANLFILYPALFLSLLLFLYISYKLFIGTTHDSNVNVFYATISVLLVSSLIMFNRNELTFQHANTRIYAISILFFSLLLLLLYSRIERKHTIIFLYMLAIINLVLSHVLFPLIVVSVPIILIILDTLLDRKAVNFGRKYIIFIPFVTWLLWNLWNYTSVTTIKIGIISFFDYLYHELGREIILSSLSIREPIPIIGIFLRNFFKITIIVFTLISLVYILYEFLLFKKRLKNVEFYDLKIWLSYILGTILVFGITIFSASLGNSIGRFMITYIPLIVPLTLRAINSMKRFVSKRLSNKLKITIYVLALIFLTCVIPFHFLLLHEISVAEANTIPLDATCTYLSKYLIKDLGLITVTPFMIYYRYFDPNLAVYKYSGDIGLIRDISQLSDMYLLNHGVKVVDYRSIVVWSYRYESYQQGLNEWLSAILEPLYMTNSLIYQNGGWEWIFYD